MPADEPHSPRIASRSVRVKAMAPLASVPSVSANAVATGLRERQAWRIALVAAPHLGALLLMAFTEADLVARTAFVLSWGALNAFWLVLLRRPGLSGLLSLALFALLFILSRFKYDVLQMTANFVDIMVVDTDALAFLFALFPNLRWVAAAVMLASVPLAVAMWRVDPFQLRRRVAALIGAASFGGLVALALSFPQDPWEGYLRESDISKFARSAVSSVVDFANYGFMESDAAVAERLKVLPDQMACHSVHPSGRRPHIIMVHDESSFDLRQAPWHQRAGRIRRAFQVVRRQGAQFHRRGQWRAELVHRIQRAVGPVVALLRALLLFRHPHCVRPRRARPAAGAERLRLSDTVALSRARRLHGRAGLSVDRRHRQVLRRARARHARHRARPLLLRRDRQPDVARAARISPSSPSSISPPITIPGRAASAPISRRPGAIPATARRSTNICAARR